MLPSDWIDDVVNRLAAHVPAGYEREAEPASEPTALTGLALVAHGRAESAELAGNWLTERQAHDGSIGVSASQRKSCWPTAWAMMLWHALEPSGGVTRFREHLQRAVEWTLAECGKPAPRKPHFGHDSTLVGWSWAANTHSWLEPTAMFVLALKAAGHAQHERTRKGVRIMIDRQLPSGGCNYGNTIVLGQELLPHVQPTGLAMMALASEETADSRIERSLTYLQRDVSDRTATASLSYGLMGMAAHHRSPPQRDTWLRQAYARVVKQGSSPYKLALIALAAAERNPLIGKPA